MWNKFPNTPPDIPETENFGIDYEVKYKLPNGKIETTITEWLWEKKWNWRMGINIFSLIDT